MLHVQILQIILKYKKNLQNMTRPLTGSSTTYSLDGEAQSKYNKS